MLETSERRHLRVRVDAEGEILGRAQGRCRLTAQRRDEARAFNTRSLAGSDYVYVWVDGIPLKVRLEQDNVRLLVIIGVRANGRKDWSRSPTDSANPPSRGRTCSGTPNVAAWPRRCSRLGDGALEYWKRSATYSPERPIGAPGGARSATCSTACARGGAMKSYSLIESIRRSETRDVSAH